MSYFFNGDFEDFLASDSKTYTINSNKKNQEFEYLILWLEEEELYTTKKYESDYLSFIEKNKDSKPKITTNKSKVKLWCQNTDDKKLQRVLNSKRTSTKFAIENNFAHPETKICVEGEKIKDNFLYKDPLGMSGIGIWKGSQHKDKISSFLKNKKMIEEPLLERTFDIGCCVLEGENVFYQNHIDEYFQYKGTTLGLSLEKLNWFEEYKRKIEMIKKHYREIGIRGPYSIDSFLYKENGIEKLYALSEVNARKTMGYTAIKLWEKYFPMKRYCSFKIIAQRDLKTVIDHNKIFERFNGEVIPLSPNGNIFFTYLIGADSIHDLHELEDDLLFTLLKDI